MQLIEYLKKEDVKSRIDDFLKSSKKIIPKESGEKLERLSNSLIQDPSNGVSYLNQLYEFKTQHSLFSLFWRMNRPKIIKDIPFVVKNGVKGCKRVLDIGCSDGLKTIFYGIECPETQIIGIDRCAGPIKLAKEKAEKYGLKNTEFIRADLETICFKPESFDSVIATYVLHETFDTYFMFEQGIEAVYHFDSQLKEIYHILAPQGKVLISLKVGNEMAKEIVTGQILNAAENAKFKEKANFNNNFGKGKNETITIHFVYQK